MTLTAATALLEVIWSVYIYTGLCLILCRAIFWGGWPRVICSVCWRCSKWPALAAAVVEPVLLSFVYDDGPFASALVIAIRLALWWMYRNAGDDDDTKKLKKMLTETVERLRGKLVVVAVPKVA